MSTTVLQKAVTPQMSAAYLERGLDRVCGYVVPAADVAEITSTAGLFELHGLGFPGTPFSPERPIDVLHMPSSPTGVLVPATGGTDEAGRRATGGPFLERPPFSGTGAASAGDVVATLSWLEHTRITPGARLWRFSPGADEPQLIGTYHGVVFGWQNHLAGDEFHVLAASKYVGPVARTEEGTFAADVRTDDDGVPTVVTIVTVAPDPEEHGFTRTAAGTWAKQLPAEEVTELFEIHASARWHGIPVRVVDQGPGKDGKQYARVVSLAHDADMAERLEMDKLDAGVYETTVPVDALTDVVYAQRIPKAWAREGQLEAARARSTDVDPALVAPARTASAPRPRMSTPRVTVGTVQGEGGEENPLNAYAPELQRVAEGLVRVSPTAWQRIRLLCRMAGTRGEVMAAATGPDEQERPIRGVPEDVARALAELRHKSASPEKGAWFTALVTLESGGKLSLSLDYTNEPRWGKELEAGQYAADLRRYPRTAEHTPDWLREAVERESAGEDAGSPSPDDAGSPPGDGTSPRVDD